MSAWSKLWLLRWEYVSVGSALASVEKRTRNWARSLKWVVPLKPGIRLKVILSRSIKERCSCSRTPLVRYEPWAPLLKNAVSCLVRDGSHQLKTISLQHGEIATGPQKKCLTGLIKVVAGTAGATIELFLGRRLSRRKCCDRCCDVLGEATCEQRIESCGPLQRGQRLRVQAKARWPERKHLRHRLSSIARRYFCSRVVYRGSTVNKWSSWVRFECFLFRDAPLRVEMYARSFLRSSLRAFIVSRGVKSGCCSCHRG